MTAPAPLACVDFSGLAGCPGCCASCHDDSDAGYSGMCDVPGDPNGEVCCEINGWLCGLAPDGRLAAVDAARLRRDARAAC